MNVPYIKLPGATLERSLNADGQERHAETPHASVGKAGRLGVCYEAAEVLEGTIVQCTNERQQR